MAGMALQVALGMLMIVGVPASTATPFISDVARAESCVQVDTSYFVSSMSTGFVKKYNADGSEDTSWTAISGLTNPRGLTAHRSSNGDLLWVAHDGGVGQYSIGESDATLVTTYDTSAAGAEKPNGLCLNDDASFLFATQPGWKPMPYGADGTNALVKIDLLSGDISALFADEAGHTPNGCIVEGETIWMINQKDGVTSFDTGTNTGTTSVAWSAAVVDYQSGQFVGDGIVKHGGKFYLSSWKPMPLGGAIHVCDPSLASDQCSEFAAEVACDMQLGGSDSAPVLLLPSLMGNSVKMLALPSDSYTCGDIKAAYKSTGCCGFPAKEFMMPGSRRLSAHDDEHALLASVISALEVADAQGGTEMAKRLASSISNLVQPYHEA